MTTPALRVRVKAEPLRGACGRLDTRRGPTGSTCPPEEGERGGTPLNLWRLTMLGYECPDCRVTLELSPTEVRCWRCGWTVRDVDNPREYNERADAIREAEVQA